jgi:hypothetical protein
MQIIVPIPAKPHLGSRTFTCHNDKCGIVFRADDGEYELLRVKSFSESKPNWHGKYIRKAIRVWALMAHCPICGSAVSGDEIPTGEKETEETLYYD